MWLQDRSGGSVEFLNENLQKFLEAARKRPELGQRQQRLAAAVPQIFADVNRDKVLKQGVAVGDVYQTLQAFLGGIYVNQFNRFGRQWKVFLQAEAEGRVKAEDINQFYVRNNDGDDGARSRPLATTRAIAGARVHEPLQPLPGRPGHRIPAPGYSSGQAMAALEEVAKEVLPREMGYDWADLSYQEEGRGGRRAGVRPSIVFVFLILAALYESWSLPFSVLLSVPVAVFGAFLGLLLRSFDFDVYGQIGLVMLIGLAAKNAILIVEFAEMQQKEGKSLVDAALEGAKLRLRPILMTSFAFILGCVPLWTAAGAGAVSRKSWAPPSSSGCSPRPASRSSSSRRSS